MSDLEKQHTWRAESRTAATSSYQHQAYLLARLICYHFGNKELTSMLDDEEVERRTILPWLVLGT